MEKQILKNYDFELTMLEGFGLDQKKIKQVILTLDELELTFKNFLIFISKAHLGGTLDGIEYIDPILALNNFIMAKVDKIVEKKGSFYNLPLCLIYSWELKTTKFNKVKETLEFFDKHDCFKNKFIRNLKGWLLKQ